MSNKRDNPNSKDKLSPSQRSDLMSKVRSKNTKPEIEVRKLVYSLGYRYRLHVKSLPGSPDMAFKGRRKVIFINGCFWHGHNCPSGMNQPKSNTDYWIPKIKKNIDRDKKNQKRIVELGWRVLLIWECELKDIPSLKRKIQDFLN